MRRTRGGSEEGPEGTANGARFRVGRRARLAGPVVLLTVLGGLTGCADRTPEVPPTATGTLEDLAARAGCEPELRTGAEELRLADCRVDGGRFVLATFATDRGQREWLNGAKDYGGTYLVGRAWVAVGEPDVVGALRRALGGRVEESAHGTDTDPDSGTTGHGGH
ncbi:hypothetical protein [Streptomyces sp. NPDC005955]|jgi:hypothetical protein|uniref:hypothetical protein n=1 Tax=Streptomyces sp. NPDC005955 TaxID=3364738 RepID=UPI0036C8821E